MIPWSRAVVLLLVFFLGDDVIAGGADTCKSTAIGDLRIEHLAGTIAPGDHVLRVWLPPGYDDPANQSRSYPVLYVMDGQNLFDVCPSMNHDEWRVDEALTALIETGKVEPLIVVGIDAPDDGPLRASELVPFPDLVSPFQFEPKGAVWPAFLAEEVLPQIARHYRVRAGRESTGIGGASYGAIAALYALITHPHVFGRGLIESPWTTVGNGEFVRLTRDLTITPLRVSIGVGDLEAALYAERMRRRGLDPAEFNRHLARDARRIAENLRSAGGEFTAVRFTETPGGKHDEASWRARFPAAITFLFPVVPGKNKEKTHGKSSNH
jgi:enterochelin esterase-like enzyme